MAIAPELIPYIRLAFDTWRTAKSPDHVVLVLHGTDGVGIYALSVVDAQVALAAALTDLEPIARMAVEMSNSPGEGKFWLMYMLPNRVGLAALNWQDYIARRFN